MFGSHQYPLASFLGYFGVIPLGFDDLQAIFTDMYLRFQISVYDNYFANRNANLYN